MQKRNEILKEATKMFAAEKDVTEQEAASMVNFKGFSYANIYNPWLFLNTYEILREIYPFFQKKNLDLIHSSKRGILLKNWAKKRKLNGIVRILFLCIRQNY